MTASDLTSVTRRMYAALSASPGRREWSTFRRLFRPGARLIRVNQPVDGDHHHGRVHIMSVDDYVMGIEGRLDGVHFEEKELSHSASIVGDTAAVQSDYEAQLVAGDGVRKSWRGVNLLQLIRDPSGWRIISIIWDAHAAPPQDLLADSHSNEI